MESAPPNMSEVQTVGIADAIAPPQDAAGILQAVDAHAIVAVTDRAGRITYANDRFCEISKYSRAELLGQDHRILNSGFHPRTFMKKLWTTIGRGGTWHGEFCNRAKDGSLYWVQSTVIPVMGDNGKPEQYVAIRTDVSHIKRIEAALATSEERFRFLFERSADALLVLDVERAEFIDCNQATLEILSLENRSQVIGCSPADLSPPLQEDGQPSTDKARAMIDTALGSGSYRFEWLHCSSARPPFPVEVVLTVIVHDDQKLALTTWRDISQRRRAEAWQAHHTEILDGIVKDVPIQVLLDQIADFVHRLSPNLRLYLRALSADGSRMLAQSMLGSDASVIHPECRDLRDSHRCRVFDPLLAQQAAGQEFCSAKRCPALQGPPKFHFRRLDPLLSSGRQRLGSVAVFCRDGVEPEASEFELIKRSLPITALVVERAQIAEQRQLTDVVFNESSEAIALTDETGRILVVNETLLRLTGFVREEVLGQALRRFFAEHDDEAFHAELAQSLAANGRWQGECWMLRKSGGHIPVLSSVAAVLDHIGTPCHRIHVMADRSKHKLQEARIERLSSFDELTQLPNRLLLNQSLDQSLAMAANKGHALSLLCIDLDRFKELNDSRGHAAGDQALIKVALRFRKRLADDDLLARTGGDEFAVITERRSQAQVEALAKELLNALSAPLSISGHAVVLGASIGIARFPEDGRDAGELLRQADIALYRAKAEAVGYCFYVEDMGRALNRQLDTAARLGEALLHDRLQLFFQPLVDLRTRHLAGAEALLRWDDAEQGWMSPSEFVPVAESRGMMPALGDWVLRRACKQVAAWRAAGHSLPARLGINISAQQLGQPDLVQRLQSATAEFAVSPTAFELELTESSVVTDPDGAIETMSRLTELGFSLAIDDFGTGYSSLNYLKRFPAHKLKIDMSFVRDMLTDRNDRAIVKTVIAMAETLGMKTIAEGVETTEQAEQLLAMGGDIAQGYLFDKALPADIFQQRWLRTAQPLPG